MQRRNLGRTGLSVSRLCFGSLTIGPLQANLPLSKGAAIIKAAFVEGVNFIDTAEIYNNYGYIREAIKDTPDSAVIASKSYAVTYDEMQASVERACNGIGREYIDIFMLHEQTSRMTLKGHGEAFNYLVKAKEKGIIRAIGVSTHTVEVVKAAAMIDEIDVIHPIFNMRGIGIVDGQVDDMQEAITFARLMGKGIYTMKALGGGHLAGIARHALEWILARDGIDAVAVGMQSVEEVRLNCKIFSGQAVDASDWDAVAVKKRRLIVEPWCTGCGTCARHCPAGAIAVVSGAAEPDLTKCILCGYCGARCPEFCLKII